MHPSYPGGIGTELAYLVLKFCDEKHSLTNRAFSKEVLEAEVKVIGGETGGLRIKKNNFKA